MKTKKIVILLCLLLSTPSYSAEQGSEISPLGLDDFNFSLDSLDEEFNAQYDQEIAHLLHQTRAVTCEPFTSQNLVTFAVGLNFPVLEQFNIYKFTYPPVIRILHDLPSLRPWYGCDDKLCLYGTFFLNEMPRAYFTHCGTTVADYLFVSEDDAIIQELENLIPDVPTIIPLFNNARLQMHRLGVMLGASKCFGNLRFNAAVPLYYMAWNFFLNQTEVDALNAAPFFNGGQPLPNGQGQNDGFSIFDPNTFIDRHLISDKFGLGDIRLYLDYLFCSETRCPFRIGGQLTLPNNTVIRHSIIGNQFNKCYPGPGINFDEIACLALTSQGDPADPLTLVAKNELAALSQSYGLQLLDRLSATVLENQLGQRHVSYGALFETFIGLTKYTNFCIFFEWDQFVKGHEDRPVKLVISPGQSLDRDYTDEALANDNLTFLQQRLINIIFPPIANVQVKEGDIFKFRFYSQTNWRVCQWDIGYDLWYQRKEQVLTCCSCALPNAQLDILAATKPAALQGKIFGHFNVLKASDYEEDLSWRLGLKGEGTVNNFGIGKDWLVGIDFVADF
jgi:hypothetical protein